ncbi:MAG: C69 family dipeptidase [Bacteroidaceae bacterium]|nr:C69 family dipeptidase [Bacteroidaceae bacterium]
MKKIILTLAILAGSIIKMDACSNIIVGKKASADGSVIVSYNADSYGMYGNLNRHVGGTHEKGEMRKIYDWDTNRYMGEIPQVARTYNVVGQMNENQVSITETTFGGREELVDTAAIMDYGSLIYVTLERATSARHAIQIMTDLVAQYGYASEGESFSICDKNEAWIMEMIGKGNGNKGANWVAIRIPDDCICAHANQSRITTFNLNDKENVLYSKDIIKFARAKGFFTGKKDTDFSFRDAFAPNDFSAVRYCDARAWSVFNRFCDGMDKYIEYAKGNDLSASMPLYMKPNRKISVQDVMNGMRDHYEGTPFDIQNEVGAGPYNMPYRPSPLSFEADGKKYFNERPISTQQTGFCFVGQMRSFMPDAVGGIAWFTNDDPNMAPFCPIYCSVACTPRCFSKIEDQQDDITFSWNSAFWVQNTVSNMVYPYYSKIFPDLKAKRDAVENKNFEDVAEMDKALLLKLNNKQTEDAKKKATDFSQNAADNMMNEWKALFQFIVVKHNDMVTKKTEANGKFIKTKYGYSAAPERPGYPEAFRKTIIKETGDKYLLKE